MGGNQTDQEVRQPNRPTVCRPSDFYSISASFLADSTFGTFRAVVIGQLQTRGLVCTSKGCSITGISKGFPTPQHPTEAGVEATKAGSGPDLLSRYAGPPGDVLFEHRQWHRPPHNQDSSILGSTILWSAGSDRCFMYTKCGQVVEGYEIQTASYSWLMLNLIQELKYIGNIATTEANHTKEISRESGPRIQLLWGEA